MLGEDIYTLSDLRESNEELNKVYFENLLKNSKLLDMRSRSDMCWNISYARFISLEVVFHLSPLSFTRG
jgi:hypothetical protein